jgi:hypothetical protein
MKIDTFVRVFVCVCNGEGLDGEDVYERRVMDCYGLFTDRAPQQQHRKRCFCFVSSIAEAPVPVENRHVLCHDQRPMT